MSLYSDFIAHDKQILQIDGIDSDIGAFPFTTSGTVTFNQNLIMANGTYIGAAVNQLVFDSNGDSYFNAGNVGIGTASPSSNLHISSSVPIILFEDTNVADKAWLFRNNNNVFDISHQDGVFVTEKLTIQEDGKVGIGTTDPRGALEITTDGTGTGAESDDQLMITGGASEKMELKFGVNNTGKYSYIQSTEDGVGHDDLLLQPLGGNVGIGTASPAVKLVIVEAQTSSATPIFQVQNTHTGSTLNTFELLAPNIPNGGYMYWAMGKEASNYNRGAISYHHISDGSTSNYLDFGFYGAGELLNILASGKVGIGTASPTRDLHVEYSSVSGNQALLPSVSVANTNVGTYPGGGDYSFSSYEMTAGNGAIQGQFFADGTGHFLTGTPNLYFRTGTDSPIIFGTNSIVRVIIQNDGKVGIGTTSPSSKLHVAGDTTISGSLDMDSHKILNVVDPSDPQNAATKNYVDTISGTLNDKLNNIPFDPPLTSSGIGTTGDIAYDSDYFYVCIDTNVWKRTALSSW